MNREAVLNLMDRGVLPTAEEQAALGLSGIDLVRRWMDGGHAELQRAADSQDLFELLWRHTGYGERTERFDQRKRSLVSKRQAWEWSSGSASEMGDLFQWWGYTYLGRIGLTTYAGGLASHCNFTMPAPDKEARLRMEPGQIIDLVGYSKFQRLRKAYACALYLMP